MPEPDVAAQVAQFRESGWCLLENVVPPELIAPFDASELELLISGLPEIDVADLRRNTESRRAAGDPRARSVCAR